jgi:glutamyl-tRNA reductase
MLTRGIVNKIAHGPISQIRKQAAADNGTGVVDAIRNIFRLEE